MTLLIFASALAGCTQIPVREFTSYKETFNRARMAGEEVLIDYGAALHEKDRIDEQKRAELLADKGAEGAQEASQSISSIPFDPIVNVRSISKIDVIGVRMQAWEVVARYNDALTALAEGKSAAELTATVEGLANSLANFPIGEVAEAVGSLAPWLGSLKTLVAAAETQRSRRKFLEAVTMGAPLIHGTKPVKTPVDYCKSKKRFLENVGFIGLLKADASDFYCLRLSLHLSAKSAITDPASDLARQFNSLSKQYKPDEKNLLKGEIDEMNMLYAKMGLKKGQFHIGENPQKTYTDNIHAQLVQIKEQVAEKARKVENLEAALAAYQQTLVAYVKLIDKLSKTTQALRLAAEVPVQPLPSVEELSRVYIELRQAIEIYKNMRRI